MPLIKCPECENVVSNKAPYCPRCGFPISKTEKRNKAKFVLYVIKRYTLNFFVKLPLRFKKIFDSTWFNVLIIIPILLCGIVALCALCILGFWLFEQLFEFNSTIGLISFFITTHILGYFFLYRNSRIWVKIVLWLFLIFEIVGIINIYHLFNS